jgi:phosphoglycolate phosphatase
MKKYVIWDFNGTILDDLELCLDLLNQMLAQQDKQPITVENYKEIFGFPIKDYYQEAGISFENISFDALSNWFIELYQPLSLKESLHKDVIETLSYIKSHDMKNVLLSASQTDNLKEQIKHFKIEQYFDYVIGTDNVKAVGKVERGISFMNDNQINKDEVIYIGDTIHDYEVAKAMGVEVVLFDGGHQSNKRLNALNVDVIQRISDIIKYIR